jgi:uncharacterized protein
MTAPAAPPTGGDDCGPVTVVTARRVRAGREADYEAWVRGITAAARDFPGHLGVSVLKPSASTGGKYVLVVNFDSYAHQRAWEESAVRAGFLAELEGMVEGEAEIKKVSGLEFWFDLPELPAAATPNRHRMTLVLIAVVFVLVLAVNLAFGPWLATLPLVPRVAVVVVLQVLALSYLVMPLVTRVLKGFLYPR